MTGPPNFPGYDSFACGPSDPRPPVRLDSPASPPESLSMVVENDPDLSLHVQPVPAADSLPPMGRTAFHNSSTPQQAKTAADNMESLSLHPLETSSRPSSRAQNSPRYLTFSPAVEPAEPSASDSGAKEPVSAFSDWGTSANSTSTPDDARLTNSSREERSRVNASTSAPNSRPSGSGGSSSGRGTMSMIEFGRVRPRRHGSVSDVERALHTQITKANVEYLVAEHGYSDKLAKFIVETLETITGDPAKEKNTRGRARSV
ncbi:uncharacterized protein JCM15063_006499 [Sporobolomyces koalae]|uniref:uncharacterized protein n=1 Tax=Sporobolomyces koalae TaxID=500713 RepID=UPI00318040A2